MSGGSDESTSCYLSDISSGSLSTNRWTKLFSSNNIDFFTKIVNEYISLYSSTDNFFAISVNLFLHFFDSELFSATDSSYIATTFKNFLILPTTNINTLLASEKLLCHMVSKSISPSALLKILPFVKVCFEIIGRYSNCTITSVSDSRQEAITYMCKMVWDVELCVALIKLFFEEGIIMDSFSPTETSSVISKLQDVFLSGLSLTNLSTPFYHILLVANSKMKLFFTEQLMYRMENSPVDAVFLQSAGTVMLHILTMAEIDQTYGRDSIKFLKMMPSKKASPFCWTLLFMLLRIHRLEAAVMEIGRSWLIHDLELVYFSTKSSHVNAISMLTPCEVKDNLFNVIDCMKKGWDSALEGLVKFIFFCFDGFVSSLPGDSNLLLFSIMESCVFASKDTYNFRGAILCVNVFSRVLDAFDIVSDEIVGKILDKIFTLQPTVALHYISLLEVLISRQPQLIIETVPKVRTALHEAFYGLPIALSYKLLYAFFPLMLIDSSFKDSTLLLLKKSLYHKSSDIKRLATAGHLLILKKFEITTKLIGCMSQSSQSFFSQMSSSQAKSLSANDVLCNETLYTIKKCLNSSPKTRLEIYSSLPGVIKTNPKLYSSIISILSKHILKYVETDRIQISFDFSRIVLLHGTDISLSEPLPHLLCCVLDCLRNKPEEDLDIPGTQHVSPEADPYLVCIDKFQKYFTACGSQILKKTTSCSIFDDPEKNSSTSTSDSKKILSNLVITGLDEVMMQYTSENEYSNATFNFNSVIDFYKHWKAFNSDLSTDVTKSFSPGHLPPSVKFRLSNNLLNLSFIVESLRFLLDTPQKDVFYNSLPDSRSYIQLLFSTSFCKLTNNNTSELSEFAVTDISTETLSNLAKTCLNFYDRSLCENDVREVYGINIVLYSSACFVECITWLLEHSSWTDLTSIFNICEELEETSLLVQLLTKLLEFVRKLMDFRSGEIGGEEMVHFFRMIDCVVSSIPANQSPNTNLKNDHAIANVFVTLCEVFRTVPYGKINDYKQILVHLLAIGKRCQPDVTINTNHVKVYPMKICFELTKTLHSILGDIDDNFMDTSSIKKRNYFAILHRYASQCHLLVVTIIDFINSELDEIDYMLNLIKKNVEFDVHSYGSEFPSKSTSSLPFTKTSEVIRMSFNRMAVTIPIYYEFLQTRFISGLTSHNKSSTVIPSHILKSVTKLYILTKNFTQFLIFLSRNNIGRHTERDHRSDFMSKYQKLISLIGTNLTPFLYSYISFLETVASGVNQQIDGKSFNIVDTADSCEKKKSQNCSRKIQLPSRAELIKEGKVKSDVIFSVEELERYVIELSKLVRIDFMEGLKMTVSRDFRLISSLIQKQPIDVTEPPTVLNNSENKENEEG